MLEWWEDEVGDQEEETAAALTLKKHQQLLLLLLLRLTHAATAAGLTDRTAFSQIKKNTEWKATREEIHSSAQQHI